MPRIARIVIPGLPHHITQRGNFGQTVFDDDNDRRQYLIWLNEYANRYHLKFWAYCLMTNHVHFIAIPGQEDSLAKTFNQAHMRYSQYLNRRHGVKGHLWQGRFYSCVLDEAHLYASVRYVERNPVRAGLILKPEEYLWSSAPFHVLNLKSQLFLADDCPVFENSKTWKKYLSEPDDENWLNDFRQSTHTGRPLGGESFILKMESLIKRKVPALNLGRPCKKTGVVSIL